MKRVIFIAAAVLMLLALTACVDKPVDCAHENIDFVEVKSPTCTEDGLTQKVCLDCNAVLEENVSPAVGHVWMPKSDEEGNIVLDEEGNPVQACALCGYVLGDED